MDGCYKLVQPYSFVGNLHWCRSTFSHLLSVFHCTIPLQELEVPLTQYVEIAITSSHPTVPPAEETLSLGKFWTSHGLAEALYHQIVGFTTEYSPDHVMVEWLLEVAAELYPLNKHIFGRAGVMYLSTWLTLIQHIWCSGHSSRSRSVVDHSDVTNCGIDFTKESTGRIILIGGELP